MQLKKQRKDAILRIMEKKKNEVGFHDRISLLRKPHKNCLPASSMKIRGNNANSITRFAGGEDRQFRMQFNLLISRSFYRYTYLSSHFFKDDYEI